MKCRVSSDSTLLVALTDAVRGAFCACVVVFVLCLYICIVVVMCFNMHVYLCVGLSRILSIN